jgi:hypothetical protein
VYNAEQWGKLEGKIFNTEPIHLNTSITIASGKQELKPAHTWQNEEILLH